MSSGSFSIPSFTSEEVADLVENILEASTEYSMIATDLEGTVLLWNEGARRRYGYEPAEITGASTALLHQPEDVEDALAESGLAPNSLLLLELTESVVAGVQAGSAAHAASRSTGPARVPMSAVWNWLGTGCARRCVDVYRYAAPP